MATRADIIRAARTYAGVPFVHQGRSRAGLDCIGLVLCAAQDCGLYRDVDYRHYAPAANGTIIIEQLTRHLDRIALGEMDLADVLVFAPTAQLRHPIPSRHAALLARSPLTGHWNLLHAYNRVRCVVEQRFTDEWAERLFAVYRLRGVED